MLVVSILHFSAGVRLTILAKVVGLRFTGSATDLSRLGTNTSFQPRTKIDRKWSLTAPPSRSSFKSKLSHFLSSINVLLRLSAARCFISFFFFNQKSLYFVYNCIYRTDLTEQVRFIKTTKSYLYNVLQLQTCTLLPYYYFFYKERCNRLAC